MDSRSLTIRIQNTLELARWYPSGDNCQPFRFRIEGDNLQIFHLESKARHLLNNRNHASCLSLGGLLEYLRIAATGEGLGLSVDLKSNFLDQEEFSLWAEVGCSATDRGADDLIDVLPHRRTDRRPFDPKVGAGEIRSILEEQIQGEESIGIHVLTSLSEDFKDHCVQAETLMWEWPQLNQAIFDWICLQNPQCVEGMPYTTLGVLPTDLPLMLMLKKFPGSFGFFKSLGMFSVPKGRVRKAYERGPVFFALSASELSERNLIQVGQVATRKWLALQAKGYALQPLSLPVLGPPFIELQGIPEGVAVQLRQMRESLAVLKRDFGVKGDKELAWMFRAGKPVSSRPTPPSFRHSVNDLLL